MLRARSAHLSRGREGEACTTQRVVAGEGGSRVFADLKFVSLPATCPRGCGGGPSGLLRARCAHRAVAGGRWRERERRGASPRLRSRSTSRGLLRRRAPSEKCASGRHWGQRVAVRVAPHSSAAEEEYGSHGPEGPPTSLLHGHGYVLVTGCHRFGDRSVGRELLRARSAFRGVAGGRGVSLLQRHGWHLL